MTTYTNVLRLAKPATGELNWGTTVNDGVMNLVDDALSGRVVDMTSGAVTLNPVDGGTDTGARSAILLLTGTPSGASTLTCPNQIKCYTIQNECGQTVTVGTSVATTTVAIPDGGSASVLCDGSDNFYFAETYITGTLAATAGNIDGVTIGATTPAAATVSDFETTGSITEAVYAMGAGVDLDPANGTIQTKSLSANVTFTESLASGQSMVLQLTGGASYTVTWPTVTWVSAAGNIAPTLSGSDVIIFWKISTTLYASYAGNFV